VVIWPLFIKVTCRFSSFSCISWLNWCNVIRLSKTLHHYIMQTQTNFRMNVPFTAQYCNLHNYTPPLPPERFPRVYYSPAAQNQMSAVLTVLFSTLHVYCVAWRQAVLVW
jgi:hypothetical protein